MSKCCIGLGKCTHFYCYILTYVVSYSLTYLILHNSNILNKNNLIQSICRYFSFLSLGIVFFIIFKKNLHKNNKKRIIMPKNEGDCNIRDNSLIFNNKPQLELNKQDGILFFIICLIYVLYYEIIQLLSYLGFYPVEFCSLDIIIVLLFMYLYYPQNTYRHQIYSMAFVSIINTILLISASLYKNYNDYTQNIYEYKGYIVCSFGIINYFIITFLIYYSRMNAKHSMDNNFISPYKIIIFIGIIGFILEIVLFLIFLLFKKKCDKNDEINMFCYFNLNIKELFAEFSKINNKLDFILEIVSIILFIICSFMNIMSELFIIKYLNPSYILISENIYYEVINLYEFLPKDDKKNISDTFIILQIAQLFEFLGCMIYLEIIELRFFGLDKNLKTSITIRSEEDIMFSNNLDNETNSSKLSSVSFNTEDEVNLIELKQ